MKVKNVFVITPLGEDGSEERAHANKMKEKIWSPIEKDLKCSIKNALDYPAINAVADGIFTAIKNADVVIADMAFGKLNVFYEIGLAHALNKQVVLIRPKEFNPPTDLDGLHRIEFSGNRLRDDFDDVEKLKRDLTESFNDIEKADEKDLINYLPYSAFLKETTNEILSDIDSKIKNLEELITRVQVKGVVTEYIRGEKDAFVELTKAVNSAGKSVLTTRFSQHTVRGRQNDFYETIKYIMGRDTVPRPENFQRIIATNKAEKLDEVLELVRSNMRRDFIIYLSQSEYNFEIVIVDEETVFIHFRKNEREDIISATLKVRDHAVAIEFKEIFNSIAKGALHTIKCVDINDDNLGKEIAKIKESFHDGLKRFDENAKNSNNITKK